MFGKTGQISREVLRHAGGHEILALDRTAADLADPSACASLVRRCDADIILNAAAYTAVDRAESEPEIAHLLNAAAPGTMARAARERGLPFLHVSTDYVFNGSGNEPWKTGDGTGPINVYGQTKLLGEAEILASGARAAILRTSWVFSAHGSNFVKTILRLGKERSVLNVVDDQVGGPTSAADIAKTLIRMAEQMISTTARLGVYHYAGSPDASWRKFASEIISQASLKTKVTGISSSEYPMPALRPLNSRLDCERILADFGIVRPDWKIGLTHVLQELGEMA